MDFQGKDYAAAVRIFGDVTRAWNGDAPPPEPRLQIEVPDPVEIEPGVWHCAASGNLNWSPESRGDVRRVVIQVDLGDLPSSDLADPPYTAGFGAELWLEGEGAATGAPPLHQTGWPYIGAAGYGGLGDTNTAINLSSWPRLAEVPVDYTDGEDAGGGHLYIQFPVWAPSAAMAREVASTLNAYFLTDDPGRVAAGPADYAVHRFVMQPGR